MNTMTGETEKHHHRQVRHRTTPQPSTSCHQIRSIPPMGAHARQPLPHRRHRRVNPTFPSASHRSNERRTPQDAYTALPKATPMGITKSEWRSRTDKVDRNGKLSLRYAGEVKHLGVGRAHAGKPVLMLIHDKEVTVSELDTGDILGEYTINPAKNYQSKKIDQPQQR